jgi:hypothetical protein
MQVVRVMHVGSCGARASSGGAPARQLFCDGIKRKMGLDQAAPPVA